MPSKVRILHSPKLGVVPRHKASAGPSKIAIDALWTGPLRFLAENPLLPNFFSQIEFFFCDLF